MYHQVFLRTVSCPVVWEVGMLMDAPAVCMLWIHLAAILPLLSLMESSHLSFHFPSSVIVQLLWRSNLLLWTIPQKDIKCASVMVSLPQGHCRLFASVAWYGHALVALRYKISLKLARERSIRCLYLFLDLTL